MAQTRKPEVEERIVAAAVRVFADRGFAAASIADIAAAAAISTGNVYRYFAGKDAVFAAAVPASFVRELRRRLQQRVRALRGVADVDALAADAPYRLISEELLAFVIAHRLQVVIALGRAEGTPHAGLAERLVHDLVRLAVAHAASLRPAVAVLPATRFVLESIYRGFVATLIGILARFEREADIRAAVDRFSAYHLTGLGRLLAPAPAPERRP